MHNQVQQFKEKLAFMRYKCAQSDKEILQKYIDSLPERQRPAVSACFNASQCNGKRGVRYTTHWVYECLLLRIKSRTAYEHLREYKILALPTRGTLNRYIKAIKGSYGFDENVFKILKKKTSTMDPEEVRGKCKSKTLKKCIYFIVSTYYRQSLFVYRNDFSR